eukprot:CAMPEP_0116123428 /NCGR_PEP_ID=MMETSP0329-20121206/4745_1 /TAXON_ID=697910 /ORGANISM="Pseudo-nitzschia arenysensis, Strain B593" /LENGTH=237 /DNA_ID=CAMNT_0003617347 /DNA_START=190 /DNA_END=903 /DNA_ORIENTATION=-
MGGDEISWIPTLFGIAASLFGFYFITAFAPHVYRILRPSIVEYPWDECSGEESQKLNQTVVFAASYNPPHHGHIRMLEYLSRRYKKVIAVVGFNPKKKYLVSPEERADLLREMLKSRAQNVTVEVVEGYIWRYAKRIGASIFFRGIRSWEKDGRDERHLQMLNTWGPLLYGPLAIPIPTIYIEGDPRYNHVSSTLIRSICDSHRDTAEQNESIEASLSELVPSEVAEKVAKLYGAKQ